MLFREIIAVYSVTHTMLIRSVGKRNNIIDY